MLIASISAPGTPINTTPYVEEENNTVLAHMQTDITDTVLSEQDTSKSTTIANIFSKNDDNNPLSSEISQNTPIKRSDSTDSIDELVKEPLSDDVAALNIFTKEFFQGKSRSNRDSININLDTFAQIISRVKDTPDIPIYKLLSLVSEEIMADYLIKNPTTIFSIDIINKILQFNSFVSFDKPYAIYQAHDKHKIDIVNWIQAKILKCHYLEDSLLSPLRKEFLYST